jgi:hypothetical protein
MAAVLLAPVAAVAAEAPTTSREELMQKWDINRDGKVDEGEADVARSRMRRARIDAQMNSGTDPLTGRPRVPLDPVTGRPTQSAAGADAEDGGLILVPGNGERPLGLGGAAAHDATPAKPAAKDRDPLPGTRVTVPSVGVPSVQPRSPSGAGPNGGAPQPPATAGGGAAGDAAGRARLRPGMPPPLNPQASGAGQQARPRTLNPQARTAAPGEQGPQAAPGRPGIISGGVRAGAPAGRPGYGAGGPPTDLNAGRLPGGLPQTRGTPPATAGAAGTPRLGPGMQPRATVPGRSVATPSTQPGASGTPTLRPGMRPQVPLPGAGRSQAPATTPPRVPRVTPDDFYGR